MSEQALELKSALSALRRRKALFGSLGAIGLLGGLLYGLARPPMPSAQALVLLPAAATAAPGTPTPDTRTQIAIAASEPVLAKAGKAVSPPVSAVELKKQLTVSSVSQNLLSVQVRAQDARKAEKLANAVARDYISYVTTMSSTLSGSDVNGLEAQAAHLTKEVKSLQNQIATVSARLASEGATSAAGQQDVALLGSLRTEQASSSEQLNTVTNQIAEAKANGALTPGAIRILQRATTAATGSSLHLPITAGVGVLCALFVGLLVIGGQARRDRRLYRRSDIAAAVGLPVVASLGATPCKTVEDWNRLLEQYQPSTVDALNLRRLLHRFDIAETRGTLEVQLVSFADDRPAIAVGPQLATFAASAGIGTALVLASDPVMVQLRAACAIPRSARPERLLTLDGKDADVGALGMRLIVSTVALERVRPELCGTRGSTKLLAVSSGSANPDDLARVALAALEAGQLIEGIVVVNPDPADKTSGDLPEVARRRGASTRTEPRGRATSPAVGGRR